MTSEGVDSSRSSEHFATVRYAPWNEIFFARIYRNPHSIDDERIATLHDKHVFVIIMHVLVRCRIFGARPKRHLASIFPIEDIAFNTGRCLIGAHNSVNRVLHETGEGVHADNINAPILIG